VTSGATPGQGGLGPLVERFDAWADGQIERVRGTPAIDRLMATASHVGDFSMVWHATNLARFAVVRRPDQLVAFALALGAESVIVNQGVKRLFRRERPTTSGDERTPVRTPSTSAFPSGHASSAAFAATMLTAWSPLGAPLWWGIAGIVGTSRAYVRIHHPSDVVGGFVVGGTLGLVTLKLLAEIGFD
jgi:membrane-associated phospholipid phosphatase